jgi:TonB family protein
MKTIITLLLFTPLLLTAQNKTVPVKKKAQAKTEKIQKQKKDIIKVNPLAITTNPQYPGGMEALDKFVKTNFKMPRKDRKKQAQGEVMVKFTISDQGRVIDAKIVNGGMSEKINIESLRVINSLPQWKAGTSNGKDVDVMYVYTIKIG